MVAVETAKSFVNAWECDENGHLNVQSYYGHFDVADRHFRLIAGVDDVALGPRLSRHVRYHRELLPGDVIAVHSFRAVDAPYELAVAHELVETTSGELAATALDVYWPSHNPAALDPYGQTINPMALARGLPLIPPTVGAESAELIERGGDVTYRGVVWPSDCDADGRITDRQVIARFSDAAGHAWEHAGISKDWLDARGFGRVAVESRLCRRRSLRAGDLHHIVTQIGEVSQTTFVLWHAVYNSRTGDLVMTGEVVALVMDKASRKAVALPEEKRTGLLRLSAASRN